MKMQVTKEFQIQLGLRIRQARKAVSLTQEQLADKLDVNKKHISNIERGKNCPSLSLILGICDICKVSSDQLLFGVKDDATIPFLIQRACRLPKHQLDLYLQHTSLFLATLSEAHSEFHNDPAK